MSELSAVAETLAKYGAWAIVAVLILAVRALFQRINEIHDARMADLKEFLRNGITQDAAVVHALDKLEEAVKAIKP